MKDTRVSARDKSKPTESFAEIYHRVEREVLDQMTQQISDDRFPTVQVTDKTISDRQK